MNLQVEIGSEVHHGVLGTGLVGVEPFFSIAVLGAVRV